MGDLAVLILHALAEIRDVAEGIEENDRQACRLSERVMTVERPLLAVQQGTRLSSSKSLRQLLGAVEEILSFLREYAQTTWFTRARRRKAIASKFTQLGAILTEGMQALHLDVAVDDWAAEDASDHFEDVEGMVDAIEKLERNRTDNHAEIMAVLKALRNEERAELTGWIEVDYGKDLDFEGSALLGSGAFGEVRTAKWNGTNVAVKHLLGTGLPRDSVRALRKEVRVHSSLHFDFVAPLYAASTIAPHLCLVVELASGGSLEQYLRSAGEPLPHPLQTAFLYDIARGMLFLHLKGILHRDLKSANVLMFNNGRLKLCDFGLSKVKTDLSSRSTRGAVGTVRWMSPEEMDESPANERTDMYSFGVVCFEVTTRALPFQGKRPAQVMRAVLLGGERPAIPEEASPSPDVVPLMTQCWKQDPTERPEGFGIVVRALASIVSRTGDPRDPNAAAVRRASPSGAENGRDVPRVNASAKSLAGSGAVHEPSVPTGGSSPAGGADAESTNLPPPTTGGIRDIPAPLEYVLRPTVSEPVVPAVGRVSGPCADLPIATNVFSSAGAPRDRVEKAVEGSDRKRSTNGEDARAGSSSRGAGEEAAARGSDPATDQVNMRSIYLRLKTFVGMSMLKKVALNVIAQSVTQGVTQEEIGHLTAVFVQLDTHNKGAIGPTELQQVMELDGKVLENSQEDAMQLLHGIDIAGSNTLSLREFIAATMERKIFIKEENIRCAFDYFDIDGNSEITFQNLVKIFGQEGHARSIMGDFYPTEEGSIKYFDFRHMMIDLHPMTKNPWYATFRAACVRRDEQQGRAAGTEG